MKKLKKSIIGASFIALLVFIASAASAQTISVTLDGEPLHFGDVPPARVDGRVLVPLRSVFVALGAQVDYQAESRTVLAQKGKTNLRLQIGSKTAYVDGESVTLDVPAQAVSGRTLVPLRFVSEALGAQVAWHGENNTVVISASKTAKPKGKTQIITGDIVKIDTAAPGSISIESGAITRTYHIVSETIIERQPQLIDGSTGKTSPIALAQLSVGANAALTVDGGNNAFKILSKPTMITSKVRNVEGNIITLEDEGATQVAIGSDVSYINKSGSRSRNIDVKSGDQVALFISESTQIINQVSGFPEDVQLASETVLPQELPSDNNLPQINLVEHDAMRPLKAGDKINVTMQGTPKLKGTFDVSPQITNQSLNETQNGVYSGTYTVRAGDDILNGRITAHLTGNNGYNIIRQSEKALTIDTKSPVLVKTIPSNGAVIDVANPNILIDINDHEGSGLAPAKIKVTNGEDSYEIDATVTPSQSIRAVIPRELKGKTDIEADISDNAGNTSKIRFSFDVTPASHAIKSINHNATRALSAGDILTVEMMAPAGGRASFNLTSENNVNNVVAQEIPLIEIETGRYRGSYNVMGTRDEGTLTVIGRYRNQANELTTKNATIPIKIINKQLPQPPSITSPKRDSKIKSSLTVSGKAAANNTVRVNIHATGTQYHVLPYSQDFGTVDIVADESGSWRTGAIKVLFPKGVSNLQLTITAIQEDSAGRESKEASITLRP